MKETGSRRKFVAQVLGLGGAATALSTGKLSAADNPPKGSTFVVRDFGAAGDGTTMDTKSLQAAIDACARAGGGTVLFTAGNYLTGTLFLKSRVTVHLEAGAVLLGSRNLDDYPKTIPSLRSYTDNYTERSLFYGENLQNVALHGRGVIDGQGSAFRGAYKVRPYLLRLVGCRGVSVRELTFKDSPMWVQHYLACEDVCLDGLTVASRCNGNNDGIDIDGCERVRIANCDISSGDDAIVLKSTLDRPCRNVVITNCVLSSDCNAFKLGTESNGGFENIALSNCTIYDTNLAGIALELVDGGALDGVSISNVTMRRVGGAVFIRLGNRARPFKEGLPVAGVGTLRNVMISDVQATGVGRTGCSITGLAEHPVREISLHNLRLSFAGGGTEDEARRTVPEHPEKYPEYNMFGPLPAYGFYCRHAASLRLSNVSVQTETPDQRPSLVCYDVAGLEVCGWQAAAAAKGQAVIRFCNVSDALVQGCRCPAHADVFLHVSGNGSAGIHLVGNELSAAGRAVSRAAGVGRNAVIVKG